MNLGIDLGGVIVSRGELIKDSFETVAKLVKKFDDTYIVSRVNSEQRERSIKWIESSDFCNLTGIPRENIYHCFDRRDKAVFVEGLGINTFIDDRPEVLLNMKDSVRKICFNPSESDLEKHKNDLHKLEIVKDWKEIEEII